MSGYIMWHIIYINTIEYYSALKRWKFSTCIQMYISVYVSVNSDNFIYPFQILIILFTFLDVRMYWVNVLLHLEKQYPVFHQFFNIVSLWRWKYSKTVLSIWWLLLSWVVNRFCQLIFCIRERIVCVFYFILCVYVFYFSILMLGN